MRRRYNIGVPTMDETPEEMEQIRREAGEIDVNGYRRRFRWLGRCSFCFSLVRGVWPPGLPSPVRFAP